MQTRPCSLNKGCHHLALFAILFNSTRVSISQVSMWRKKGAAVSLYDDVVEIAKPYMGPASERFVSRQITGHLSIEESELTRKHLEELAKWCYVSGKLIISDDRARELSDKVKALRR